VAAQKFVGRKGELKLGLGGREISCLQCSPSVPSSVCMHAALFISTASFYTNGDRFKYRFAGELRS
jgi:hypothetical protein